MDFYEVKLAMISQPMNGLSSKEIKATRYKAEKYLNSKGYKVVDTYFEDNPAYLDVGVRDDGVYCLGMSLLEMSKCELVYFIHGWENARGCVIEHEVAVQYGIDTMYEDDVHGK